MAKRTKSGLKANRQNIKRREQNRAMRSTLRTAIKGVRAALAGGDPAGARAAVQQTVSVVDKMAAKNIIHRNTAARHKSRIAARLAKLSAS